MTIEAQKSDPDYLARTTTEFSFVNREADVGARRVEKQ